MYVHSLYVCTVYMYDRPNENHGVDNYVCVSSCTASTPCACVDVIREKLREQEYWSLFFNVFCVCRLGN